MDRSVAKAATATTNSNAGAIPPRAANATAGTRAAAGAAFHGKGSRTNRMSS